MVPPAKHSKSPSSSPKNSKREDRSTCLVVNTTSASAAASSPLKKQQQQKKVVSSPSSSSASAAKKQLHDPLPAAVVDQNSSNQNTSLRKAKKTVKIAELNNETTVFNASNPVSHMTSFQDVDWKKEEAESTNRLLQHRAKHTALDPKDAVTSHPNQQAFHVAQIPYVVDTESLTVAELKKELHARNLPTRGSRFHLVKRLDAFLKEFEGNRLHQVVEDEEKHLLNETRVAQTTKKATKKNN